MFYWGELVLFEQSWLLQRYGSQALDREESDLRIGVGDEVHDLSFIVWSVWISIIRLVEILTSSSCDDMTLLYTDLCWEDGDARSKLDGAVSKSFGGATMRGIRAGVR